MCRFSAFCLLPVAKGEGYTLPKSNGVRSWILRSRHLHTVTGKRKRIDSLFVAVVWSRQDESQVIVRSGCGVDFISRCTSLHDHQEKQVGPRVPVLAVEGQGTQQQHNVIVALDRVTKVVVGAP